MFSYSIFQAVVSQPLANPFRVEDLNLASLVTTHGRWSLLYKR